MFVLKRVFLSQPMAGRSEEEIWAERKKVANWLRKRLGTFWLLDTYITEPGKPLEYLGESIKLLSRADFAVFCPGWQNYRGCRIERTCCEEYGVEIYDYKD